ncbi:MAG: outer membrane protein assembly factor BamE [Marinovum sp.]|nr:outer membrane protein assembly factor BamE [Marinovum sp.]
MTEFGQFGLRLKTWAPRALLLAGAIALSACVAQFRNHGYLPSEEELAEVLVGIDTRDTVEETIGAPSTAGVLSGGNFYYVGDTVRTFAWQAPEVVEREIVAITFDDAGVVQNIVRYGLEDGKVVPLVQRVTETSDGDISFLRKLFGNVGGLDLSSAFNN